MSFSIGETIGPIIKLKDLGEMLGANFISVRMIVDVSRPLCRGRKISWDKENEGWATFMYERLPNICYWCGSISHDNKDCSLWLRSKGTLKLDDQQFSPWIRAPLFNSTKKSFVEVKGYKALNHGVDGVMVLSNTRVPHGLSGLHRGFDNTNTPSDSRATDENDMVTRSVDRNIKAEDRVGGRGGEGGHLPPLKFQMPPPPPH